MNYLTAKLITAVVYALPGLFALAAPTKAAAAARAFPDSPLAGKILSAAAFIWAGLIVYLQPLDFIMRFRIHLFVLLIVFIPLSWRWMPRLLAARSLGGLWCLLPAPVLVASRFADDDGRLIVVSLMYVMAVAGMVSTFSPYYLRDVLFWLENRPSSRLRAAGAALLACGLAAVVA